MADPASQLAVVLTLRADFRYEDRDDRTPVVQFFTAAGSTATGQSSSPIRRAGAIQLEMYQGGGIPWSRAQFASDSTRWLKRFPAADRGKLHLLLGPARAGATHQELWARARSTPPASGETITVSGPKRPFRYSINTGMA